MYASQNILSGKGSTNWYPVKPRFQVPVYFDIEEHSAILSEHLSRLLQNGTVLDIINEVEFIFSVLFPEVHPKKCEILFFL